MHNNNNDLQAECANISSSHLFSLSCYVRGITHTEADTCYSARAVCVIHIFTVQLCSGAVAPSVLSDFPLCSRDCFVLFVMVQQSDRKPSSRSVSPIKGWNTPRSPQSPWHHRSSDLFIELISIPCTCRYGGSDMWMLASAESPCILA